LTDEGARVPYHRWGGSGPAPFPAWLGRPVRAVNIFGRIAPFWIIFRRL
jgi:hypothetical protein